MANPEKYLDVESVELSAAEQYRGFRFMYAASAASSVRTVSYSGNDAEVVDLVVVNNKSGFEL